ncbi:MAG: radical SAM protein [Candidatus Lernaella stagnicola]|nr:radical SAM protein [Candidatus Lernaella stagnicola]
MARTDRGRVALVNAPFLPRFSRSQRSPGVIKSNVLYYPYWLAHAAALLQREGFVVDLLDAPALGLDSTPAVDHVVSFQPDLVLVETSTPSIAADRAYAVEVKNKMPEAAVFLVGTHVTAQPIQTLGDSPLDGALLGEYDFTALELARVVVAGGNRADVPGVAVCGASGGEIGATRALIENLDELPWIAPIYKQFLPIEAYNFSLAHHPMVMLISGRGCPNNCFFCLYPQVMHGRRFRARSPEHVVGELEYVATQMPGVREIVFEDDTFTADETRAIQIAELKMQRGVKLPFFANLRVNTEPETVRALVRAGLRSCAVGFESAGEKALERMKKGISLERAKRFMQIARAEGLLVHGCFMVGFPGETRETMAHTLRYAIELEPDSAQFYPVFPYPGTEAYEWAERNGYLSTHDFRKWLTPAGHHAAVIDLPGLSHQEQWAFCEKAYRRFHFRPRYLVRKLVQAIRRPAEGWRSLRGLFAYLRYLVGRRAS